MKIELFTLFPKTIFWEVVMRSFFSTMNHQDSTSIVVSKLLDEQGFYSSFECDLRRARSLVVIESPFMTRKRMDLLLPAIQKLCKRGVKVLVNTKPFPEHDENMAAQAEQVVGILQEMGVTVLMTVGHHRKIAIIDDVLYEGSLNILSQNDSCEFMRRIHSEILTQQMLRFIGLGKWA